METKIAIFKGKEVRKTIYNNEWWFVIEDVISVLTDSRDPKQYIQKMKQRDIELKQGWVQIVHTLSISTDGGNQRMLCSNTEGIFRIVQSVSSKKAEPFKKWLAKVGYERVQEIEDPELAIKRTHALYRSKGYSEEWIERRIQGIKIREDLTDEWHKRGVKADKEFAILTAQIHEAALGVKPSDHKKIKTLQQKDNLRDHMTTLEHLFSQLGEESTKEIAKTKNSQGFIENSSAAQEGGEIAGNARENLEKQTGKLVASKAHFKHLSPSQSPEKLSSTE